MKSDRRKVPMRNTSKLALALLVSFAGVAMAQDNSGGKPAPDKTDTSTVAKKTVSLYRPLEIGHMRPADSRGVNVFESPKEDNVPFNGFVLSFGGAFNQEFQGLQHTNTARIGRAHVADLERAIQTHRLLRDRGGIRLVGRGLSTAIVLGHRYAGKRHEQRQGELGCVSHRTFLRSDFTCWVGSDNSEWFVRALE